MTSTDTAIKNSGSTDPRLDWLDTLKCITMFAVIAGHAAVLESPDSIKYYLYAFHLPLFFILSGMALQIQFSRRQYTFMAYAKNKVRTLLWPYLAFNLLFLPIWFCYFRLFDSSKSSISELLLGIVYSNQTKYTLPISASWFLTTLFLSCMLFFAALKICKDEDYTLLGCGLGLGLVTFVLSKSAELNLLYPWHATTVPMATMFLIFGYLFMKNRESFDRILLPGETGQGKGKTFIVLLLMVVLLLAGFLMARFNGIKISFGLNIYGNFLLFIGAVLAFSLMLYLLARLLPSFPLISFMGKNTLTYLCFHELCIIALNVLSSQTRWLVSHYPVAVALVIMFALVPVAYIIEKYTPFLIGKKRISR